MPLKFRFTGHGVSPAGLNPAAAYAALACRVATALRSEDQTIGPRVYLANTSRAWWIPPCAFVGPAKRLRPRDARAGIEWPPPLGALYESRRLLLADGHAPR